MRIAVVGHVEWVEFVRVARVPEPGEIVHALETWEEPAGGGAVAALELARLGAEVTLYTSLGGDALGRRARDLLAERGVRLAAATGAGPQRRAFTYVDETGERTITVLGEKARPSGEDGDLPWEELVGADGVYFVSGDPGAVRQSRKAKLLLATARELPTLQAAAAPLDAIVASGQDEGERYHAGDLDPEPRLVVTTAGALGGWAQPGGPYRPAESRGPYEDTYGAGDCFAAGLTFALAEGRSTEDALAFAAERGAAALTRKGAGTV
jgi:ribokinase